MYYRSSKKDTSAAPNCVCVKRAYNYATLDHSYNLMPHPRVFARGTYMLDNKCDIGVFKERENAFQITVKGSAVVLAGQRIEKGVLIFTPKCVITIARLDCKLI